MRRLLVLITVICLSAATAFAGHVDTYGIGSRATAMGGAMTAGTNDAFSVYYNPAAMTRFKKKTFTVGAHMVNPALKVENFEVDMKPDVITQDISNPDSIEDSSPLLIVPHLGYVHPINDKLAVGFAVYVPYGLELRWDQNVNNNAAVYNSYHSWYMREVITPSIAYKVNDKLSIGAGISIGKSKAGVERVRYVPEFMTDQGVMTAILTQKYIASGLFPNDAAAQAMAANDAAGYAAKYSALEGARFKTEMEDSFNYSINFGLLYEMSEKLAFGFTFRGKSETKMDGETDVKPELDPNLWPGQEVDAVVEIDSPNQIQLGVQYSPTPKWNLNFDITRTWWGDIEDYAVKFDRPFMGIADEEPYDRDWKDTFQYRFGAEYKLNDMIDLRAGYYYDPTVVPNSTFDVQWPDSDKHVISGGLGFDFGRVNLDVVLQYIKIEKVKINGESENLNHTFYREDVHSGEVSATASGHLVAYGVTVSYEF